MRPRHSACVIFAAFAISACALIDVGAENETDVRVIDLKFSAAPIAWIDNETILVRVDSGERVTRKGGERAAIFRLMAHNYLTGQRRDYGRADSQICYADGYVSYINEDYATGEIVASYGELGKETVRKIKPGEINFDRGPMGSCRPWSERPAAPSWVKEKTEIWHLWPRLGLINCEVPAATIRTQYVKARFHKRDDEIGVQLPFSCYEVFRGLQYYAFKGAFFALEFDFRHPWPASRDRRAFWLYPDGRVETLVLPYAEAIREGAIPTAKGLVAFARPTDRGGDYWVYLVTPEATKRVLRGYAAGVTSPDGCKVAMLHDPEYKVRIENRTTTTRVTLKVLELCGHK